MLGFLHLSAGCLSPFSICSVIQRSVNIVLLISDECSSEELQSFVNGLLCVLDYIFTKSLSAVQDALKRHGQDLTIKTDGRRFLFIYAKLEQLR